jgi:hypothetical protein
MTTTKNIFTVKDNKGNIVFKGICGDANAWAARNVHAYGDLFVHYSNGINVLHWFVGSVTNIWGTTNEVTNEWVA